MIRNSIGLGQFNISIVRPSKATIKMNFKVSYCYTSKIPFKFYIFSSGESDGRQRVNSFEIHYSILKRIIHLIKYGSRLHYCSSL